MPLLTDSDAALSAALSGAEPALRPRLVAELEAVRARARASGAGAEVLRLAEALVFALNRAQRVEP